VEMETQRRSSSAIFGVKRAFDSVMIEVLYNSVIECVMNMKLVILTKNVTMVPVTESG
jgi:hypothetical protein